MSSAQGLAEDNIWFDKWRFEEAEVAYQEHLAHLRSGGQTTKVTKCERANACHAASSSVCANFYCSQYFLMFYCFYSWICLLFKNLITVYTRLIVDSSISRSVNFGEK